jgi:hypothetical protein
LPPISVGLALLLILLPYSHSAHYVHQHMYLLTSVTSCDGR